MKKKIAVEYKISTIKDIYEKVPFDRVELCMKELSILIRQAQATKSLCNDVANVVFGKPFDKVGFPETLVWKDDNEGKITMNISINGEEAMVVECKAKEVGA